MGHRITNFVINKGIFYIQIAVGLRNQTVQEYSTDDNTLVKTYSFAGGEGPLKGIYRCDG